MIVCLVFVCCDDITFESVLGSPPPFLFFVEARGEPGNEASYILVKTLLQPADSFNSRSLTTMLQPCCNLVNMVLAIL